jgi:hypothetical protein
LRELVENSQTQVDALKKQLAAAQNDAAEAKATLQTTRQEADRTAPLEQEVKEQALQIGKLRHQCVTLNDHLIKSMRMLKKAKPEDNVDRCVT